MPRRRVGDLGGQSSDLTCCSAPLRLTVYIGSSRSITTRFSILSDWDYSAGLQTSTCDPEQPLRSPPATPFALRRLSFRHELRSVPRCMLPKAQSEFCTRTDDAQTDPTTERALSPPPGGKSRASIDSPRIRSPPPGRPNAPSRGTSNVQPLPPPDVFADYAPPSRPALASEERGQQLEAFQTSLPMRLDYEAMLAYILLPPAGGVMLLLLEHKSDYVRFHAWQSSMVFSCIFVLHLIFAWSSILSWLLFGADLVLIFFLASHAYHDVETLDHYEVPFFGRIANSWVDNE